MDYINYPKQHLINFITDEVNWYIIDKFTVSVLPKVKENIELMLQLIIGAAHDTSTKQVKMNSGDVDLWLKSFTQELSGVLIYSEKRPQWSDSRWC